MTADTDELRTNAERLLTVRAIGMVAPPAIPAILPDPDGVSRFRPGQGSIVLNVGIGDLALNWASDHLEPGVSLHHHSSAANRALQILSCVGNDAVVTSGEATGRRGVVVGKHGTTLVTFAPDALALLAPGDSVCVNACGVGLQILGLQEVTLHSISPGLLDRIVSFSDGRLVVRAVGVLPIETAAAGIGMEAAWANIDLETHDEELDLRGGLKVLRFGDLVVLPGQDHRYARRHDPDWVTVGSIAHGASVSGGHGLGMTTLLTAPLRLLQVEIDPGANLATVLNLSERLT